MNILQTMLINTRYILEVFNNSCNFILFYYEYFANNVNQYKIYLEIFNNGCNFNLFIMNILQTMLINTRYILEVFNDGCNFILFIMNILDQQDVVRPGQRRHRKGIVDHRFVVDRQQLLADGAGDGMQPGARSACQNDALGKTGGRIHDGCSPQAV